MYKRALFFLALFFIVGCAAPTPESQLPNGELPEEKIMGEHPMQLTSPAFADDGKIPSVYTCDGANRSPPLLISGVPATAKSLVLIMDDPDIPTFVKERYNIAVWDHWVVFNIPPTVKDIPDGKNPAGTLGKNTGGKNAYAGPCPPDREHRYFFTLYALDTMLDLPEGVSKADVEKAMQGRILAKAELVGKYERTK